MNSINYNGELTDSTIQTLGGATKIKVRFANESVWLIDDQKTELFQRIF